MLIRGIIPGVHIFYSVLLGLMEGQALLRG